MPLTDINKAITEAEVIWADQYFAVACKEHLLEIIEPWIHRELNAILRDPNPAVLFHLVAPLFISRLEEVPAMNLEDIFDARMKKGSKRVERSNGRILRMSIFIGVNGVDNGLKRIFKILWILFIKLELILPVVTATVERGYWRMEFVEKEMKNNKADLLFIDGLVTHIERDVFLKVSNDDIKSNFQAMKTRKE
ncbi:hypothetical protein Tco_1433710 [Tanacetum coccineum]